MAVTVDSPMTEQSHVTDVLMVADDNPRGGVATFHFSPASGVAEANIRVRLAATQNIIAVARMNDGSFFMGGEAGEGHDRRLRRLTGKDRSPRRRQCRSNHASSSTRSRPSEGELVEVKALVST